MSTTAHRTSPHGTTPHRTTESGTTGTSPDLDEAPARTLANPRRNRLAHVTSVDELRAAASIAD